MKKILILASGGDAPGMNACIKAAHLYCKELGVELWAAIAGYNGLVKNEIVRVTDDHLRYASGLSGCVFKCNRSPEFNKPEGMQKALATFRAHKFDALICLGGNGSFRGLADFQKMGAPVIGIPATVDNDLFYTPHNLGFSSACENAIELVDKLKSTMSTNDRDHVIQMMGRNCSELTRRVGVAANADIIDCEERRYTPAEVAKIFDAKHRGGKNSCIMITQEVKCVDAVAEAEYGVKLLKSLWEATGSNHIRMTTLGYLQRGARPSCHDRWLAVNYGRIAVDCAMNNKFGVAIGFIRDEYVTMDLTKANELSK